MTEQIDPAVPPSGTGCADCLTGDGPGWWVHLRRCAQCGHIGCCGSSPSQHAAAHYEQSGHRVITSFEPGEDWFYDFDTDQMMSGPKLAAPDSHPTDQPAPGPAGKVPTDWRRHIHT
ncbi:ubiquitin-hydrolase Zn-finger-containing protein [Stackebrandtia endophytica]|uniref:Ubiquitin-hydrolase Zn-finger-containing protein n=1 Tax=Stackebrandtia endophytica TaxID=1496996 RepID=A0A543B3F4_9ACTN|nr:UBP-type zinc finger domain-containing protein [Stackebrandtia endophytica]TQL79356.1 ubiquitin-hydrolase Zn-finger-containing protein [Stackebrandtia endophytica]